MDMPNINKFKWIIGKNATQRYVDFCIDATRNDDQFQIFRKNTFYRSVIGSPTIRQAMQMYIQLMKYPHIVENMYHYAKLDYVGQPDMYSLAGAYFSLNLIRYMDTLRILHEKFGDLDKLNILEVGAGFGGLAYCIKTTYECNYYILDLAAAMNLQQKVCNKLITNINFTS